MINNTTYHTHCTCCNDPLISDYVSDISYTKFCNKRLDHSLKLIFINDVMNFIKFDFGKNKSKSVIWQKSNNIKIGWEFYVVSENNKIWTKLPFINADFSDYKKLIDKINTIILLK